VTRTSWEHQCGAGEDPEPARDQRGGWQVFTATERGAAHRASEVPNQDAVAAFPIAPCGAVVAVADGHGHSRHFRSARGARLAVTVACRAAHDLAPRLDGLAGAGQAEDEVRGVLVPGIVAHWREAVREDAAADPFGRGEAAVRGRDDTTVAYGTTLLLAIAWGTWLLLAQIGDGDIVGIRPGGAALLPVPGDPRLDGLHTTSLCTPGAENAFRVAAVDTSDTALLGVLLATDGYANAQTARDWATAISADLAGLITTRPVRWLASQLPVWAGRCASLDGSADDTTIALILAPSAARTVTRPAAGAR
jgi:protein phosphatase 2C-like protein